MELFSLVVIVVPVYAMILAGAVVRRLGVLSAEGDRSLMRLVVDLLFPCLILDKIVGNPAVSGAHNVLVPPLVGFGTLALGYAVAHLAGRWLFKDQPAKRRTFAFTAGTYNYGYVPLPLAMALFGDDVVGVLFVHNVGVELALWTLGVFLLTGTRPERGWRSFINAPVVAIVLGVVLNVGGAAPLIPPIVTQVLRALGATAIPLALILVGAVAWDHLRGGELKQHLSTTLVACVLRLGLLPLCFLAAACWLPLSAELRMVLVVQAAMPAAMFPLVMTQHYGGDAPTALRVIATTTVLSVITTPLWIHLGMRLL